MNLETLENELRKQVLWLKKFAGPDLNDDLCGFCAISALRLARILSRKGFDVQVAHNNSHAFNFVTLGGRVWIVDCTASQFGLPEDYHIIEYDSESRKNQSWWIVEHVNNCAQSAAAELTRLGWPEDQVYQKYAPPAFRVFDLLWERSGEQE